MIEQISPDRFPSPGLDFDAATHTYTHGGVELESVTTRLTRLAPPFDEDHWAEKKAEERGVDKAEVLAEWAAKRQAAAELGHCVHGAAELAAWEIANTGRITLDTSWHYFNHTCGALFWLLQHAPDLRRHGCVAELPVCSPEAKLAGTVDLVAIIAGKRTLVDWKTNAKAPDDSRNFNPGHFDPPLNHYPATKLYSYMLQLQTYAEILRRCYSWPVEQLLLVWLDGERGHKLIPGRVKPAAGSLVLGAVA